MAFAMASMVDAGSNLLRSESLQVDPEKHPNAKAQVKGLASFGLSSGNNRRGNASDALSSEEGLCKTKTTKNCGGGKSCENNEVCMPDGCYCVPGMCVSEPTWHGTFSDSTDYCVSMASLVTPPDMSVAPGLAEIPPKLKDMMEMVKKTATDFAKKDLKDIATSMAVR